MACVGARVRQDIIEVWGTFPLFTYIIHVAYIYSQPRSTRTAC